RNTAPPYKSSELMLLEILWVSLVLGGLVASLWYQPTWRGIWNRLARLRVRKGTRPPKDARSVWQYHDEPASRAPGVGPLPTPEVFTRAETPPRSEKYGCGCPSAPPRT